MQKVRLYLALGITMLILAYMVYQRKDVLSGNPVLKGWYADPDAAVFDHEVWIYPTYSAKYKNQVFLDAFSSPNLIQWKKHPHIIDTAAVKWAHKAMWAPCIVKKDSSYFLFFSANDIQAPFRNGYVAEENKVGGIGIGISDKPDGPFKDYLGKPLLQAFYNKAQPIDQCVFLDSDGQYYLIYGGWGHCNIGKLNGQFTGLVPFANGDTVKEITPDGYVEGPFMFKHSGKYYLMWSGGNWTDDTYKVAYSIADSPLGPFQKTGTILQSDPDIATGAGHHSVLNIPGTEDWYIIYHRRPIPNEGRDHRVVCIDRMYFNPDGTIEPVKMTKTGVAKREL